MLSIVQQVTEFWTLTVHLRICNLMLLHRWLA